MLTHNLYLRFINYQANNISARNATIATVQAEVTDLTLENSQVAANIMTPSSHKLITLLL
ncbi:hypothetical protein [Psittacicella hinzii]|uniref:Uncharacterized protein n=1 Tax=Psittacicella hinzii TaxID=2028575 RepID=A0A3A1YQ20_9GAMM|nr:hypothetical protein [Psittacicella hinzii]RIY39725.1 hypothetical protein CKF58_01620 [Psittacicella hinzii]